MSAQPARLVALLVLALLVAACGSGAEPPAPTPTVPRESGWRLPGYDYGNSRNAVSTIDAANIDTLTTAWELEVQGGLTTVPLVVDDTVYVQDRVGGVYAVDLRSGALRWKHDPTGLNPGPNGVAVADGTLFAVTNDAVLALDAATGGERWSTTLVASDTDGIDIQPVVYDGKVFVSTVPISVAGQYAGGDRGVVYALDAATGAVVWSFDTVDSADLWGNPDVNSGGGAWYPPAIDPEQGIVYVGVANPAPFPGTAAFPNGASRPGPNLYTDAVVALDAGTGGLRWYFQAHPHDLFDRDLVHTMLVDTADGRLLVASGKGAHVYGLDPAAGALRWDTAVGLHQNDGLTALDGPTEILPGTFGGILTPPAGADGTVYVATLNAPQVLAPDAEDYFGADIGVMEGQVVAIDARDGAVLWDTHVPGDPTGGVLVVNDLVLTATTQGAVVALDRATGALVWQHEAPGGVIGFLAAAGDTLLVPAGNAQPPRLVALRLPGG